MKCCETCTNFNSLILVIFHNLLYFFIIGVEFCQGAYVMLTISCIFYILLKYDRMSYCYHKITNYGFKDYFIFIPVIVR